MLFFCIVDNMITLGLWVARIWLVDYEKDFRGLAISTTTSYFIFILYNFYFIFVFYQFNLFFSKF